MKKILVNQKNTSNLTEEILNSKIEILESSAGLIDPFLCYQDNILCLVDPLTPKALPIFVDFKSNKLKRRFSKSKIEHEVLKKTLGKNYDNKTILDTTPGMGVDAMIFFHLGLNVVASEINDMVYFLLQDGLLRFFTDNNNCQRSFNLNFGDSLTFINNIDQNFDFIYIDPMFPVEDKKSKSRKAMEALKKITQYQSIVEQEKYFDNFLDYPFERLILKRPKKSDIFVRKEYSHSIPTNSIRYDIYLKVK